MSFNRPDPSTELREKVYEVAENVSEQTDIYWHADGMSAMVISEKVLIEVYPDPYGEEGFTVQYKDLIGSWQERE